MGGKIRVNSKLGEGTEFTVDLYAKETDEQGVPREKKAADYSLLKGLRVLLAEDNDINVIVAKKLLERMGCVVTAVNDGEAALRAFSESEENFYAVILMDVRMPGMDGMQATREIRALDRADAATVPIIAMTADAFTNDKRKAFEVGMNAHVTKPIEPNLLYDTITYQIRQED